MVHRSGNPRTVCSRRVHGFLLAWANSNVARGVHQVVVVGHGSSTPKARHCRDEVGRAFKRYWRIGNIAAWLDDARSEEVVSDISEDDSEDDSEEDDDWGEAGWISEEDVVDDSTASIPGAEVEWDIPEPVTAEDDEEDEVELV